MASLITIDDLTPSDVDQLLSRAEQLASGASPARSPFCCALLFLTASLRTRVGFAAAAARLGGQSIDVLEARWTDAMSEAESLEDAMRTLSGLVDVIVTRTPSPLTIAELTRAGSIPIVNGGEGGGEHPTQALIDLAAIRRHGSIEELNVGIVGDLSARAVRSLGALLEREPPAMLHLIGPPVDEELRPGAALALRTERHMSFDASGLDVVYLAGLPGAVGSRRFDEGTRRSFALTAERAADLPPDAVVLSPLPLIDEIESAVYADPRVRIFEQCDHGLYVRTAVLEWLLGRVPANGSC